MSNCSRGSFESRCWLLADYSLLEGPLGIYHFDDDPIFTIFGHHCPLPITYYHSSSLSITFAINRYLLPRFTVVDPHYHSSTFTCSDGHDNIHLHRRFPSQNNLLYCTVITVKRTFRITARKTEAGKTNFIEQFTF